MNVTDRSLALRSVVVAAAIAVVASFVAVAPAMAEVTTGATVPAEAPPSPPAGSQSAPSSSVSPGTDHVPADVATADPQDAAPAAPAAAVTGATVVGELVQAWPEHASVHDAELAEQGPLTYIERSDGSSVRVLTDDVDSVPVGATVEVTVGGEVVDAPAEDDGLAAAREVLAASVVAAAPVDPPVAAAGTAVTNSVTIVRVVPAGGQADSMTVATLANAVNGPVADFWRGQSGGRIQLGTTSGPSGWVSTGASCSDPTGLWNAAAAAAGWTPGPTKHLLVYVSSLPQNLPGCSFGMAEVGGSATSGGRLYVRAAGTSVLAHELGHNFGLGHSSQLQCNATTEAGTCQVSPYRDFYDVMGASWARLGSLNTAQAARLGVLDPGQVAELTPSGAAENVFLSPVSASGGTRALKLSAANGATYWVEYRAPTGQDAWLGTADDVFQLQEGVTVRRAAEGDDTSLLLDGTPTSAAGWDADRMTVVPSGSTISLAGGDFRLAVQYAAGTEAMVTVVPRAGGTAPIAIVGQRLPLASWDSLAASAGTVSVRGWALDPDQPLVAGQVHVYVDGRGTALVADGSRPDVGAVFPGSGSAHGFSFSTQVAPGTHSVCVYAIDVDTPSRNTSLGCRSITTQMALPLASWDSLAASAGTVSVRGWALDPDQPLVAGQVHVYVDGRGTALVADGSRPDVGAVFPGSGSAHGFSFSTQVAPGTHSVCVYAIDVDTPSRNTSLGCRSITTQMALPLASWDSLAASAGTVSVRGWALDPDQPLVAGQVHVYVDGRGTALVADGSRPDVGAVFPGSGSAHGFSFSTQVAPGTHSVCVYAIDVDTPSRNTSLGCRSITA
ncbi:hypothetical protein F1C76_04960 [Geodermatophilaceae bacterium NBWT11]|nr:hypothetical protein F1C76_04960 [Geodermatophilaceae bacterium NBWT11]